MRRISLGLWYDTEPIADYVRIETSADGGRTWSLRPITLRDDTGHWQADGVVRGYGGRHWWQVSARLPEGATHVRWSSVTGDVPSSLDPGHLGGPVHGRGAVIRRRVGGF
jgi:hypothetical protein